MPLPMISSVAQNRILAAVRSTRIFRDLGTSMMLLVRILEKCGDGTECEINYESLREETGQPEPTLKNWAATLQQQGFIRKTKTTHGSKVCVDLDKLPVLAIEEKHGKTENDAAIDFVRGLRGTIDAACDGFLSGRKVGAP